MPRINAATVAEHRAQQRSALLGAARDVLLEEGYAGLSFATLASRTGLARPTVYSYFTTKDDIVLALCEAELPLVAVDITRAVERAEGPREQLAAFVRAQLRAAQQRRYRIAHALASASLSEPTRQRIVAMHHELVPSAVPLLAALGHPHPGLAAALLQGLINTAVTALDAGEPPRRVTQVTVAAALDGLGAVQ
ncbi:TetR/AcrR family transcriptional regulator [Dactylosporangium sp. AC04546]|uniref:TetR/AcrR family transcriptional regulator n=1 Tax=Dactylosporangium sp. AC04546 TaxID=2862460 RepID=UPI001EDDCBA6|nr:TetR/AcrR family transcriptional regulator [Dactylosporangium sp. AC04546]WVK78645.1 TetR/AcrR family transcriptional regulator [Dactylosporangium sp. AC04546]